MSRPVAQCCPLVCTSRIVNLQIYKAIKYISQLHQESIDASTRLAVLGTNISICHHRALKDSQMTGENHLCPLLPGERTSSQTRVACPWG